MLDCEFTESGINALCQPSRVDSELVLPSWVITRYEVGLDNKIRSGFFSNVYKGVWHDHVVAIKVLAETILHHLFTHKVAIWKKLSHPNVVKLLSALSTMGDPPWFFISPYYANGSLVMYLKGLEPD